MQWVVVFDPIHQNNEQEQKYFSQSRNVQAKQHPMKKTCYKQYNNNL